MLVTNLKRIGDKLQQIRKQSGLSQAEAAWQAGISLRAYADIERGLTNPKLGSMLKICEVFHITPDIIMTEEENPASLNYNDIISEIDMLPPKEKYAAYKILDACYQAFTSNSSNEG
ncbi:MAG: helix-turn-helix transcriptional regulator [Lachnospiraceae bacterium]|nr:helix-turn-helix transcriptional regulator [Lachnospiraceae bacterium]